MSSATARPITITTLHRRRLRDVWRSSGWPCKDMVEVELLAAGLLERGLDTLGRETLRLTDAGIQLLAVTLQTNRAARNAHELLVAQVAACMQRAGRVVWRGLSLRAALNNATSVNEGLMGSNGGPSVLEPAMHGPTVWGMAMPDVFSIRNTTVEDYVEPIVHEVKVQRSDLLCDLRNPAKRAGYLALGSECWYVLKAGIGTEADVPECCGVLIADGNNLDVARPAPKRAMRMSFSTWMVLAKAQPCAPLDVDGQGML